MSSKRPATLGGEPTSVTDASGSPGIVARRLQYLLETVRKPDGSRFTYREVLAGIEAQGGPAMSIGYLSQLVTGTRSNPMMDAVQGLARFFKVPITYFDAASDTRETDEQLKIAAALQNAGVQDIALRSAGLAPASRQLLLDLADRLRDVEGLPPYQAD